MSLSKPILFSTVAAFCLGTSLPASAQTPATSDDEARLGTVTVTAQRVEENLQDVPISITTLSGEKLDTLSSGGVDIRFLSARVPSVIAESSFGRTFPRFYIRGLGNTDFDLNASQPVSLVYDGVPYESPVLKGFPVFDVDQVEVLRGPQGTLFGRNTTGGIIKFDSVRPTEEFDAYGKVSWGTYNTVDVEGAVGGPISDTFSYRISGLFQRRDDYVDNLNLATGIVDEDVLEGYQELALRGQLMWTPSDRVTALLNVHGRDNEGTARLFRANIIDPGSNGVGANFDREQVSVDAQNEQNLESLGATFTLELQTSDFTTMTYVGGWESVEVFSVGDIDGGFGAVFLPVSGPGFIPFPSETSGAVDGLDQWTHEFRIAHDDGGPTTWQGGLFLFDEDVDISSISFDTLGGSVPNGRARRSQDTTAAGIFASVSHDVTEALTISGGVRYSDEEKTFDAARLVGPFGSGTATPPPVDISDEQISWDVNALYQVSDDVNVYARVARGFRGPSAQGRLLFGNTISTTDSETVLSYEVGAKATLFNDRLRANGAIYTYEIDDQQLTIVGGIDNTVALFNADGEGQGFELDFEAAPMPRLIITGGISYNETEITTPAVSPGCGAGCTVLDPVVTDGAGNPIGFSIQGNSFPNAPEWIGNLTAQYSIPVESGEFFAFTDWAYKGDTNFFLYESEEFGQDGYWEGGLRLGYRSNKGYEAALFARNILDEEALTGAIDFNNLTGFTNEPRIIGVSLSWAK